MMTYTGERAVPWNLATGAWVMHHHVARYAWALQFAYGQEVVDLGCGTGYGAFMLSWVAERVVGVDVSREAVAFAREWFDGPNLNFQTGDITQGVPGATMYVAFEVLEHLDDPVALVGGLTEPLVWSVPVDAPGAFHKRTYSADDIEALMGDGGWAQSNAGEIVRRDQAAFDPAYILGVRVV